MELLLLIGSYTLWLLIKVLASLFFAVVGGFGLACGFHVFNRWKNENYLKGLTQRHVPEAA